VTNEQAFQEALGFTLKWEVGSHWQTGGYVNHPADPGGETKYGISKAEYPDLDIAGLTLQQAAAIYLKDYWHFYACGDHESPMNVCLFDSYVLHSPNTVKKFLRESKDTGYKGFLQKRRDFYYSKPKGPFTEGWVNRVNDLMKYADILNQQEH